MIVLFLVCGSLEYQISDPRLQASYFLPGDNESVLRKNVKKEKLRRKLSQGLTNGIWLGFFQYDVVVCQAAERVSKNLLLPDTRKILENFYEKPFPALFKVFYLQSELPSDQENKSGFAAEPGCCFLGIASPLSGLAPKSNPLPFYIPFLTENVPSGTPDILAFHTGVPFLPTKRGEKSPAWEATASQLHRRSKIIKIIPLHGFGMLNLVPRVFSFSGMPVAERPLGTRVGEYFVTIRTVP